MPNSIPPDLSARRSMSDAHLESWKSKSVVIGLIGVALALIFGLTQCAGTWAKSQAVVIFICEKTKQPCTDVLLLMNDGKTVLKPDETGRATLPREFIGTHSTLIHGDGRCEEGLIKLDPNQANVVRIFIDRSAQFELEAETDQPDERNEAKSIVTTGGERHLDH